MSKQTIKVLDKKGNEITTPDLITVQDDAFKLAEVDADLVKMLKEALYSRATLKAQQDAIKAQIDEVNDEIIAIKDITGAEKVKSNIGSLSITPPRDTVRVNNTTVKEELMLQGVKANVIERAYEKGTTVTKGKKESVRFTPVKQKENKTKKGK